MKKNLYVFVIIVFLFNACGNSQQDENKPDSKEITESILNDFDEYSGNDSIPTDDDVVFEDGEDVLYNDEGNYNEIDIYKDSLTYIFANFISASMVEAEIGLHFIEEETGEKINFYYFDIDPVKEGLFTYYETDEAIFPELVTNPEIKDVTLKIYWKIENRHIDLADEDADVKVIKKIERMD